MNDEKIINLLEKIIELTNNKTIQWENYQQSSMKFNSEKTSILTHSVTKAINTPAHLYSASYIAKYNSGYIGLLASSMLLNTYIDLVLQQNDTSTPNTIASSNSNNINISKNIKRLYNLVDLHIVDNDVSEFIDEILNG